jgi:DNA-binding winged helix-turn-helix (wHTH) protein/predicted Zn-dependent protease
MRRRLYRREDANMQYSYSNKSAPLYEPAAEPRASRGVATRLMAPVALGPFMVDLANARVSRDGQEFALRPQVFRVLQFLIQNPGRLVDYDEMLAEAWSGARVSKHTVAVTLRELKSVLGEYGSWITIRPGYGYSLEIPESEHLIRVGQHFRSQSTRSGLDSALRCFEQVTDLEGANPRAWEALAGLYIEIGFHSIRPPRDVHKSFLQAYHRAVTLQGLTPSLQLYHALSLYLFGQNLPEAESELLRVRQANPKFASVNIHLAMVYYTLGRTDKALEELGEAEKADALSPALAFSKPRMLLYCREVDAAAACAKQAVILHPNSPYTHLALADVLDFGGEAAALTQYRIAATIAADIPWIRAAEARCLAKNGRSAEALEILSHLQRNRNSEYVDAYHLAFLLEALGRRDEAFQELERAYVEKSPTMVWLDVDTKSDTLRSDSRFAELRNRVWPRLTSVDGG